MIRLRSIRIALNFLVAFFIAVAPALTAALDSRQIGDDGYRHSLWTVKDGLYGTVQAVAQAPDGFLLIGTSEGLFCFDGLLFRPVRQQTGEPILGSISTLLPLPSGDLWIGYTLGGASLLRGGKLTRFTERDGFPLAQVRAFAETPDGSVWAATVGGLARFSGSRWNRIRSQNGSGYLGRSPWTVFTDRGGRLWVPSSHSTFYLDPGSSHFSGLGTSSERRDLSLTEGASRLLWAIEDVHHRLELLPGATIFGERIGWVPHNSTGYMLRDSLGQVWSKTDAKAVWRGLPASSISLDESSIAAQKKFKSRGGSFIPTAGIVECIAEDSQGNIWLATTEGLERFEPTPMRWKSLLSSSSPRVLLVGPNGNVYVADKRGVIDVEKDRVIPRSPKAVETAYHDAQGRTWIGGEEGLALWTVGKDIKNVPLPPAAYVPHADGTFDPPIVTSIAEDSQGALRILAAGAGEFHLLDNEWRKPGLSAAHPEWGLRSLFSNDDGVIWYVLADEVISDRDGHAERHNLPPLARFGKPNLIAGGNRDLWVGGESGAALLIGRDFVQFEECSGGTLGFVTGLQRTSKGLWLASTRGITFVSDNEIRKFRTGQRCGSALWHSDTETGLPEELRETAGYSSSVIQDTQGVLWFATRHGVVNLDPEKIHVTNYKPSVHLTGFSADDRPAILQPDVTIPPNTKRLQFQYTAVDLRSPQRLLFRYRLTGLEGNWHDAGTERVATYNNLKPGTYRLELIASSGGDVWSEQRSIVTVHLPPAWNQTKLFYFIVVLLGLLLSIVFLALERDRQEKSLQMAFRARTAERTRFARQLHDTLLQTLQGSNLIADHAHETVRSVTEAKRLFGLLAEWLRKADAEGRAVLDALREDPKDESIDRALQEAVDQMPLCIGIVTICTHLKPRSIYPRSRQRSSRFVWRLYETRVSTRRARTSPLIFTSNANSSLRSKMKGLGSTPKQIVPGDQATTVWRA